MLQGERPAACSGCYRKEDLGVESKRLYENPRFKFSESIARQITQEDGSISPDFLYVELRLGNLCNVKCRSCAPYSSSRWVEEHEKVTHQLAFVQKCGDTTSYDWPEQEHFWSELIELSPKLKHLYINGGEPLLSLRHWKFLKQLVDRGHAAQITVDYSTNMTVFPRQAEEIWPHFKKINVRASIDDLGLRNTYIRHPTRWEQVMSTLEKMRQSGLSPLVLQTVSAMNFHYLGEFYSWAQKLGLNVAHNYVREPTYLRPDVIPADSRLKSLSRLQKVLPSHLFDPLEKLWSGPEIPGEWNNFVSYTRVLDELREEKFTQTFPEFSAILAESGYSLP